MAIFKFAVAIRDNIRSLPEIVKIKKKSKKYLFKT
jgi:hypothetical protein